MKIKSIIKAAFVAVALFVSSIANAQEMKPEVFNFHKFIGLPTGAWTIDQKLDGVKIERRRSNMTLTFAQGEGKKSPDYSVCINSKDEDVNAVRLLMGNTMKISLDKNNITQVQFFYTTRAKAAYGKNYSMQPEGTYPGDKQYTYIWTGKSKTFELTNLTNKGGIEIHKIIVTCEPAE